MTIDEAKAELNEVSRLRNYTKQLKRQRDELWTRFTAIRITNYENGGGHATIDTESVIAATVDKLTELEKSLTTAFYGAQERQFEIMRKINEIPYPCSEILTRRYIDRQKVERVAVEMSYSYRSIKYLTKRALQLYCEIK